MPIILDPNGARQLKPGTKFIGADGKRREVNKPAETKPYVNPEPDPFAETPQSPGTQIQTITVPKGHPAVREAERRGFKVSKQGERVGINFDDWWMMGGDENGDFQANSEGK